jgi:hypothetical protein
VAKTERHARLLFDRISAKVTIEIGLAHRSKISGCRRFLSPESVDWPVAVSAPGMLGARFWERPAEVVCNVLKA